MKGKLVKYWWVFALIAIFIFSYYIRSINTVPDRLLSFDPIYQYRYTSYFVEWGHLPVWDEITYYIGRAATSSSAPPLMYYITALLFWLFGSGTSLMTFASFMAAIYGAAIIVPAFLLGRELSNKYGGLLAAFLIGTAPQILVRTFGSSFDTDQLVLFFLLLTLYLGVYTFRKKNIPAFCLLVAGFTAFMLTWLFFMYSIIILGMCAVLYIVLNYLIHRFVEKNTEETKNKLKEAFSNFKKYIIILVTLFVSLGVIGLINKVDIFRYVSKFLWFAQAPEQSIVNISIAELQHLNIFSIDGWILATGKFLSGNYVFDSITTVLFIAFIVSAIIFSYKKRNLLSLSIILSLFLVAMYTTFGGIRFTEFSSALSLIIIGAGFGYLVKWSNKDIIIKTVAVGLGIYLILFCISVGYSAGSVVGPDINLNWDSAWAFLKTSTPELSIVGTWWDPGHMINGLAERRNFADGAHCPSELCLYGINDRIKNLGKIMATTNETESLELIRKYQGNSPKVYWIASDDLIAKYRWLQYFGTGCDGTGEYTPNGLQTCPLYIQARLSRTGFTPDGTQVFFYVLDYTTSVVFIGGDVNIPIFIEGRNGALFKKLVMYDQFGKPMIVELNETNLNAMLSALKIYEEPLGIRLMNQTIGYTFYLSRTLSYGGPSYIVLIPPRLENTVFTKMFMLEGEGLEHFRQVFRNEQVKIYEVV